MKDFLKKIDTLNKNTGQKLIGLEKEFDLLKNAIKNSQNTMICHKIYNMIFILLEIAADNDCNLDKEWAEGSKKKQEKYIKSN